MKKSKSAKTKSSPLTTVTPLSRIIALILFLTLPFVGFYLGVQYQKFVTEVQFNQYGTIPE